jgi:hypothetical protein
VLFCTFFSLFVTVWWITSALEFSFPSRLEQISLSAIIINPEVRARRSPTCEIVWLGSCFAVRTEETARKKVPRKGGTLGRRSSFFEGFLIDSCKLWVELTGRPFSCQAAWVSCFISVWVAWKASIMAAFYPEPICKARQKCAIPPKVSWPMNPGETDALRYPFTL